MAHAEASGTTGNSPQHPRRMDMAGRGGTGPTRNAYVFQIAIRDQEKHPRASHILLGGELREALVSATVRLDGACRHCPKFGSLNLQLNLIPLYMC